MDPEPSLSSTFIDCTKIEPYISYSEKNGIKTFNTINMIDDNETIVFSEANLDEKYKLLEGTIHTLILSKEKYAAVKKTVREGLPLYELINADLDPIEAAILKVNKDGQKYGIMTENGIVELPEYYNNLSHIAIEDRFLRSNIDKINNYIIKYGILTSLPTSVFKEIEKENKKPEITVVYSNKTYQKAKTA